MCAPISAASEPLCASYIQIPMPPPTASRLPSGAYAICSIVPLPRRARTPSGKSHCRESWASLIVMFRVNTINRAIRKEKRVLIFIRKFSFVLWVLTHLWYCRNGRLVVSVKGPASASIKSCTAFFYTRIPILAVQINPHSEVWVTLLQTSCENVALFLVWGNVTTNEL